MKSVLKKFVKLICTEMVRAGAVIMVMKIITMVSGRSLEGSILKAFITLTFLLIQASMIVNYLKEKSSVKGFIKCFFED